MTLIKICGITNIDDALACSDLGADMLGFIFAESPRQVGIEQAAEIIQGLCSSQPHHPLTAGVFVEESSEMLNIITQCNLDYVQLHGGQSDAFAQAIGADRVVRVARVKDRSSVEFLSLYPTAAYFLLDTYKTDQHGGTGKTFNWDLAIAAKSMGKPIILSGGLNPDNVFDAITTVRPYAVDVSSGVEKSPGIKDLIKVKELIDHVREADNASR